MAKQRPGITIRLDDFGDLMSALREWSDEQTALRRIGEPVTPVERRLFDVLGRFVQADWTEVLPFQGGAGNGR